MSKLLFLILLTYSLKSADISGNLNELGSDEAVIGAKVMLYDNTKVIDSNFIEINGVRLKNKPLKGMISNKYGFYSITNIPKGDYYLVIKGMSYQTILDTIKIDNKNIFKSYKLKIEGNLTDEIVISAKKEENKIGDISTIKIDPSFINKMPAFFSEVDVFRTLQLLPGVASGSELSSGLYVRGGSPDQNLILLDEAIVYNPSHIAGFLSAFNADALREITLIKGSMPAEYGGRMSSVLDLTMKDGSKDDYHLKGGISLISAKFLLEGPVTDNSSFMISGRRFYFDLLTQALSSSENGEVPSYYFYDFNAKYNIKLSDKDHLYFSGFLGKDIFDISEDNFGTDFNWGNKTFTARWKHIYSSDLFTNFSFIYTNYNSFLRIKESERDDDAFFQTESDIQDFSLKGKAEYFGIDNNKIKTGFELISHRFLSEVNFFEDEIPELLDLQNQNVITALEGAIYLQDEIEISESFRANLGSRLYYFQEANYFGLEPRISTELELNDKISLIGSYSITHQFVHLITRNDVSLPTDLWFPSTETIKPSRTQQSVLGIHTIPFENYKFSIEGYYKDMQNLYEYKEDATFSLGIPLESQFTSGIGWTWGLEFFLEKKVGLFTGWIGYTLSYSRRKFEELNNGKSFAPRYDRRHDFSIVTSFKLSDHWDLGASWVYATGNAFTMQNGSFDLSDQGNNSFGGDKYSFSDRNGFRLPNYHRMDLNLTYNWMFNETKMQFHVNVYNLYNRGNAFAWYVNSDYNFETNTYKKEVKQINLFPIIPTIGFSFEF